jgi:PHP family Zn ribbon phosphoesterase
MMRSMVADLHVHSLLSPCASAEMTPRNIVQHAVRGGVDIIAITDHNACDHIPAAIKAAQGTSVFVLPGMEVETREEVHVIVLFDTWEQMAEWGKYIDAHRMGLLNDEERFGAQLIVDAWDNFIGMKQEMLLASLSCGLEEVTAEVAGRGGICIASHVDRPMYSVVSQLGFIPAGANLAAVEVSHRMDVQHAAASIPQIGRLPVVTASDAHTLQDFISGPKTVFYIEYPSVNEIVQALNNKYGRRIMGGLYGQG